MKTHFFKLAVIILLGGILFVSCSVDEVFSPENKNKSLTEVKTKSVLNAEMVLELLERISHEAYYCKVELEAVLDDSNMSNREQQDKHGKDVVEYHNLLNTLNMLESTVYSDPELDSNEPVKEALMKSHYYLNILNEFLGSVNFIPLIPIPDPIAPDELE